MTLLQYITQFKLKYEEAELKATLNLNEVGRTHLLLKRSGLPEKYIDDLKLKIDGDLSKYEEIVAILTRLAKENDVKGMSSRNVLYHHGEGTCCQDDDGLIYWEAWPGYETDGGIWAAVDDQGQEIFTVDTEDYDWDETWEDYPSGGAGPDENGTSANGKANEDYYGGKGNGKRK